MCEHEKRMPKRRKMRNQTKRRLAKCKWRAGESDLPRIRRKGEKKVRLWPKKRINKTKCGEKSRQAKAMSDGQSRAKFSRANAKKKCMKV